MVADGSRQPGRRSRVFAAAAGTLLVSWIAASAAQFTTGIFEPDPVELDHPAIGYRVAPRTDPVAQLNARLLAGTATLAFDGPAGYLRSLLNALDIPVESQMAVFSKTSLQGARVNPSNPRTIFFNDDVAVAWMRGGFIEIAAQDPRQGIGFYLLPQEAGMGPRLFPDGQCLGCHYSATAEGVPGLVLRSIPTAADGATLPWLGNATMDHRTPPAERWGGWYVTGRHGSQPHLGNLTLPDRRAQELPAWSPSRTLTTLAGRFDTSGYLSEHSDIVALLVFQHQARVMNLLTRAGWLARLAAAENPPPGVATRLPPSVNELVDYLLFVGEAPLEDVSGTSGFAAAFAARGPRDSKGRSLRDLDLKQRLMRYPCSYMVYSAAFDGLPDDVREMVYRRMKQILSGDERDKRYAHLASTRSTIVEILRGTKKNLPVWF
ncbi:MAG: hypothetical protein ACRD3G_17825 [Vicinamibacterales bacterium]